MWRATPACAVASVRDCSCRPARQVVVPSGFCESVTTTSTRSLSVAAGRRCAEPVASATQGEQADEERAPPHGRHGR